MRIHENTTRPGLELLTGNPDRVLDQTNVKSPRFYAIGCSDGALRRGFRAVRRAKDFGTVRGLRDRLWRVACADRLAKVFHATENRARGGRG